MKKIINLVVVILMLFSLAACGNSKKNDKNFTNQTGTNFQVEEKKDDESYGNQNNEAKQTKTVYVIRSFYVVQGAVIYDTEYDKYGYPSQCRFHKKCEACGYVSNDNGSASGNLHSSYHCIKCGNNQQWEIKADGDWIEVNE